MHVKPPPQSAQRAGLTDGAAGEADGSRDALAAALAAGADEGVVDAADGDWLADGSVGPQPDTRTRERMAAMRVPVRPGLDTCAG